MLIIAPRKWRSGVSSQLGVSVIEIMVSLVAGLIVVGSVLSFTVSTLQANTQNVEATRLNQDLRSALNLIGGELKRAGWDENAVRVVDNLSGYTSPFRGIAVGTSVSANDCIVYGYDNSGGTAGTVQAGEVRAFRRVVVDGVGVIEVHRGGGTAVPACDGTAATYTSFPPSCSTANWCAFTDPRVVNVTALTFAQSLSPTTCTTAPCVWSRRIAVSITGRLRSSSDTVRSMQTRVRVRADCVSTATASSVCTTAPVII